MVKNYICHSIVTVERIKSYKLVNNRCPIFNFGPILTSKNGKWHSGTEICRTENLRLGPFSIRHCIKTCVMNLKGKNRISRLKCCEHCFLCPMLNYERNCNFTD